MSIVGVDVICPYCKEKIVVSISKKKAKEKRKRKREW